MTIELTSNDKIPQRSYDLETLRYAAAGAGDLAFECRSPPKKNDVFNCVAADGDVHTYDILSNGAEVARVSRNAIADPRSCDGGQYIGRTESITLRQGAYYCMRTPDRRNRIVAMRVTDLPGEADSPPLRIGIEIGVWER